MRFFTLTVVLLALASPVFSQQWTDLPEAEIRGERHLHPKQAALYATDPAALRALLVTAPHERDEAAESSATTITIPGPDGSTDTFRIVRYDLLHAADATAFPSIGTWYGTNPDVPGQTIFLDFTPRGFHATVSGGDQPTYYLDPLSRENQEQYQLYVHQEPPANKQAFNCGTPADPAAPDAPTTSATSSGDCVLRQYIFAVSATPEYSNYHGATSAADVEFVHAAVVTTLNRVNQIFTRDLSLRLQLPAGNEQLYFYSAEDSPFPTNTVSSLLANNTAVIDERLGAGTYSLGHVFTQGDNNGIARLRSGCSEFWPGAGATSLLAPEGDVFDVDYVSHEIGHQLGANHTQNNNCNYSSSAGMEPGSGSTIMGYAGICPPNVQANSDAYFHGRSIEEITTFLELEEGGTCATVIGTGLSAPELIGDSSFTVPFGTPLRLRALATGDGILTHNWEQYDAAQAPMPPVGTSTEGPLFRSLSPVDDTARYVPSLLSVLSGFNPVWEEIPQVGRKLNFRMTTRNTNATYGCTSAHDVSVAVNGDNGPFRLTDPANANQWSAGQTAQVRWAVSGTDGANFASPTVDVLYTNDNGQHFDLLATGVPNDGYAEVTAPTAPTTTGRILVRSTDNIFYNVSPQPFTVVENTGTPTVSFRPLGSLSATDCFTVRDTLSYRLVLDGSGGATELVNLALTGLPASVTATFAPASIRPGGSFQLILSGLAELPFGDYDATLTANSPEASATIDLGFRKLSDEPSAGPGAMFPTGSIDVTRPTLTTGANAMDLYEFELAGDPDFQDLLYTDLRSDTAYALPDYLTPLTRYYWRVRSRQSDGGCGISRWSEASFVSGACYPTSSTAPPVTISDGPPPQIAEMTLTVPGTGALRDLDVHNLSIDHTFSGDLRVELVSPAGTIVPLLDRNCGSENNFRLSFDDEAPAVAFPCPAVAADLFLPPPAGQLSAFDGEEINGPWTLRATDLANQDGGQINAFSLVVCLDNLALPVTFLSFTAMGRKDDILLRWATETEDNNAGFHVERTTNTTDNWRTLGRVSPTEAYRFTDVTARRGVDYVYRLRQTDLDGRVTYSGLRSARLGGGGATIMIVPNPTDGLVYVHRSGDAAQLYRVTDLSGRTVLSGTLRGPVDGVDLTSLPASLYFLRTGGRALRIMRR